MIHDFISFALSRLCRQMNSMTKYPVLSSHVSYHVHICLSSAVASSSSTQKCRVVSLAPCARSFHMAACQVWLADVALCQLTGDPEGRPCSSSPPPPPAPAQGRLVIISWRLCRISPPHRPSGSNPNKNVSWWMGRHGAHRA